MPGGFFGGEGFVLQRLERRGDGSCEAFLKCGGQLVLKTLEAGETLRFSSGALVAFESSAAYDVQMLSGFKNILFGGKRCWSCSLCPWLSGNHTMTCSFHLVCCTGEGLFITTVTGPGRVMLQALPVDRMLTAIAARVPAGGGGFGLGAAHGGVMGGGGGDDQGNVEGGEGSIEGDAEGTEEASGVTTAGAEVDTSEESGWWGGESSGGAKESEDSDSSWGWGSTDGDSDGNDDSSSWSLPDVDGD